ncbi:MAG: TVP38/TMEM64 family protein [Anaerolineae bacterium]|nr:TVP38/TMEM64 family protein [Anaerolineae bacterium]
MEKFEAKAIIRRAAKWLVRGIIALAIIALVWVGRRHLLDLLNFFGDKEAVTTYLEPFGFWGPLLYLLILGIQVLTVFIPAHPLLIAAGYLYGFLAGLALNLSGVVLVSQLVFVMARRVGTPLVHRLVPANILDRWEHMIQQQGFFFFLLLFWFPIIPSNATNYLAGLSPISFWFFFLANLLGRLPGVMLMTLIGSHGFTLSRQQWMVIIPAALVVVAAGRYLTVKIERHFKPDSNIR